MDHDNARSLDIIYVIGPTESILTKRGDRHPSLAAYLKQCGPEVCYITSNFDHAEKRWFSKKEVAKAKSEASYSLVVVPVLGYFTNISVRRVISNFLFSSVVFLYLFFRGRKKSLIVFPSRPVELIFFASIIGVFRDMKSVMDIQDVWPDMLVSKSKIKNKVFTLYCNLYLYASVPRIHRFFHVAPSFENWLRRYAPAARSSFIPLGYDAARWGELVERKYSSKIVFVCVALLQKQIDLLPFLEAMQGRDDLELVLIGDEGEGERYSEVVSYIRERNIGTVRLLGRLDRQQVVRELAQCHVGLMPMLTSSIPNKVFDYVGSGLPQLVLGHNDSALFVTSNDIGWACDYDAKAIGDFLDRLTVTEVTAKAERVVKVREQFSRDNIHSAISKVLFK